MKIVAYIMIGLFGGLFCDSFANLHYGWAVIYAVQLGLWVFLLEGIKQKEARVASRRDFRE